MAGFTITISPDNDPDAGTRVHVDFAAGSARVTELIVRPAEGGTLSASHLAMVNLDALISALAPPVVAAAAASPGPAAGQLETTAGARPAEPSPPSPDSTVSRARSSQPGVAAARVTTTVPKTGRKTGSAKAPSPGRGTAAATSTAGQRSTVQRSAACRAYRRMPEPDAVLDAYRRVGGTTALARYFGVPRHTASSWLRRLRPWATSTHSQNS